MSDNKESPAGFDGWREACAALMIKPGEPSRCGRYPIHSSAESIDAESSNKDGLERSQDDFKDLQDMLDNYEETENEKKMHKMVDQWKDELLRMSPMIRFMSKHLSIVGCSPLATQGRASNFPPILVTGCPDGNAGGFSPSLPGRPVSESGIVICSNRIMDKTHLERTLAHEMIHWWDHCRFKVNWDDLRHHACTEIRAAALSGDCRWTNEVNRRNFAFRKQFQACTRRRAILSVTGNPNCPNRQAAERAVDEVFANCFNDTRPFDEVY